MDHQEFAVLQSRFQKVEWRLRLVLAAWMVSIVVLVLLGIVVQRASSQPGILKARALDIIDAAGQTRITLYADASGPVLGLYGTPGKLTVLSPPMPAGQCSYLATYRNLVSCLLRPQLGRPSPSWEALAREV